MMKLINSFRYLCIPVGLFIPVRRFFAFLGLFLFISLTLSGQHLLISRERKYNKFGYKDSAGHLVIPYKFDTAFDFSEGLAVVGVYNSDSTFSFGFINSNGKIVIPCSYYWAESFQDSLAVVHDRKTDRWGYIDHTGRLVLGYNYEDAWSFSEGLAAVKEDDKWGYIDKNGHLVFGFRFNKAGSFENGVAEVAIGDSLFQLKNDSTDRKNFSNVQHLSYSSSNKEHGFWSLVGGIIGFLFLFGTSGFILFSAFSWGTKGVYKRSRMSIKLAYYGIKRTKFRSVHNRIAIRNESSPIAGFYRDKLQYAVAEIEKKRGRALSYNWIALVCAIIVTVALWYWEFTAAIAFAVFYVIFLLLNLGLIEDDLRKRIQVAVTAPLIRFINKDLVYHPDEGMELEEITRCSIFQELDQCNNFTSQNLITGTVDKVAFRVAEVHAPKPADKETFAFKGVLFIARFNKRVKTTTLCRNDLQPFKAESKLKRITLENLEFNAFFETFSGDETECRYVLSPVMMERILAIQARLNHSCFFVFEQDEVYIGTSDFFRLNIFESVDTYRFVENYYQVFRMFYDVVKELHLNVHIWHDHQI